MAEWHATRCPWMKTARSGSGPFYLAWFRLNCWRSAPVPQAGKDEWISPCPGSATQGLPQGASPFVPSLGPCPVMPAPTAKVNCIQQMCKVVRDIKASQMRGKAGRSLQGRENHQCSTSEVGSLSVNSSIARPREITEQAFVLGAHRTVCYQPRLNKNSLI